MMEVWYHTQKMSAEGKVWDGKTWVKQITIFKRVVKNAKRHKSIYK